MTAVWVKALLFVGAGVTAAAGTAYLTGMLDPWFANPPQTLAAVPAQPETKQPETAPQEKPAAPAVTVPQPEEPQTTPKQARLLPPTFDLLRVEPDGSVVIAGKATPKVLVEVLDGDTVIASTMSTPDGDFVAVLDVPLAPGDYQLLLRARDGEEMAISTETAVVSIPETPSGEVLAMVDEPGKPTEIVTVPAAVEPAVIEPPAVQEVADAPADEEPAAQEQVEEPAAPAQEQAAAEIEDDVAAEPAADEEIATAEDEKATEDQPAPGIAAAPEEAAAEEQAGEEAPAGQEIASLPQEEAAPQPEGQGEASTPDQPAVEGVVAVEAVEIEGGTIFVAGSATPGRMVRVYADALLLGDARASEGGRFLVETRRDLPVGDYVIRADLLDDDGTVIARAAVPFQREPGETIAAVAPQPDVLEAPAGEAPPPAAAEAPAEDDEIASAPVEEPAGQPVEEPAAEIAAAPAEPAVTAPPLQRVDGAVIIRRGDNLWRISRRVYGMGVRYSTIYLANQDQIADPDRIWPGQVFSVPQETEEGEAADMDAMGDQMVPPETESKIVR